jgi:hypothetical protein
MTERKTCVKCQRAIDATAGICPYCNWNQAQAAPSPEVLAQPSPASRMYTPPEPFNAKRLIIIGVGVLVMLIGSFFFGMVINRDGAPTRAPETVEEQAAEHNQENLKPKRADTPLVFEGQGGIEQQPITSAPLNTVDGAPDDAYARTDATAVSAAEYAQMAKRAAAEKRRSPALVDPRSITGAAYAQGSPLRNRRPNFDSSPRTPVQASARIASSNVSHTRPVPTYQPLPPIRGEGKARFTLMVGADGRVHDVNVEQMMHGGNTGAIIGSLQSWRFRPATNNGEPVAAPYTVEISFKQ